jgi:hypothetical protein
MVVYPLTLTQLDLTILLILLQTKPITHAPQIFSQFASLTLNAPSTIAEILVSIEQIQARKVSF